MSGLVELLSGAGLDVSDYVAPSSAVAGRVESDLVKLWQDRTSIVGLLREAKSVLRSDVRLGVKCEAMETISKSPLNYSSPDVARMALADLHCWVNLLDASVPFYNRVLSNLSGFYFSASTTDVESASDLVGPSRQVFLMKVSGLEAPVEFVNARQRYFTPESSGFVLADGVESDLVSLWQDRAIVSIGRSEIKGSVGEENLRVFDERLIEMYDAVNSRLHFSPDVVSVVLARVGSGIGLLADTDMAPLIPFYKKVFDELSASYK